MTGEINRVPQGLLGLLDMKARGNAPRVLNPEAQLVLESRDLYLLETRRFAQATTANTSSLGNFSATGGTLQVPSDELWLVYHHSVQRNSPLAAGTTYRISPTIWTFQGTNYFQVGPETTGTTGELLMCSNTAPYWALPSWIPGAFVHAQTLGTSVTLTVSLEYARFRI